MLTPKSIARNIRFLFAFLAMFQRRGCMYYAASLAFNTMFAIVPLLLVGFAVLSFFPPFHSAASQLEHWILSNFLPSSAHMINAQIDTFVSHSRDLSYMNFAALFIIVILMIYNAHTVVNIIWNVKSRRSIFSELFIYLVVLVVSPILLSGVFLFVTSVISDTLYTLIQFRGLLRILTVYVIPFICTFLSFSILLWVLPSCYVPVRYAAFCGLVTTILFMAAKYIFVLYMEWFHTYQVVYGALALLPIFLLWVYIVWLIFLFGAMLCHHLTRLAVLRRLQGQGG